MKNFSFDNLIKGKVLEHEAPVPANAWENISRNKDRKRPLAIWWITGLLLCVGLGVFGLYQLNNAGKGYKKHMATVAKNDKESNRNTSDGFDEATTRHPGNENSVAATTVPSTTAGPIQNANSTIQENKFSPEKKSSTTPITIRRKNKLVKPRPGNNFSTVNSITNDNINPAAQNNIANLKTGKQSKPKLKNKKEEKDFIKDALLTEGQDMGIAAAKRGVKKKTTAATKIAIQAPGTEAGTGAPGAGDGETFADPAFTNVKTRGEIQQQDSTPVAKEIQENKSSKKSPADAVTAVLQPGKKINKKRLLYVDISGSGLLPVQQNDHLLSVNRITTAPLSRSEYKANSVRTALDPSLGVGFALRKNIGKQFYLSAGFQYAVIKESVRLEGTETNTRYSVVKRLSPSGTYLVDDTVANSSTGTRIINAVNSYRFLSIPVLFQYDLVAHRSWNLLLTGGFYFNIHSSYQNSIGGQLEPFYASAKPAKKNSGFTVDGYAGIRLSKSLGKHFQLFGEPGFQFNFMRYRLPNMINYKNIHRAGLQVGLSYALPY